VRVRFAPSPTGVLHVGGARTALFNWLFAKSQGGELVLRVEDTDVARSTKESEDKILEGLQWCGITWDEGPDIGGSKGPYRQSERIKAGIYQEQLDKLIAQGDAYKCFLTPEELDAMRAEAERNEIPFVVDSPWKNASPEEVQEMLDKGAPYVYRFRIPYDEEIVLDDMVLGEVIWNSDDLGGDFIIVRQNGTPMYNFGVVVDDALMDITHVLRAQEHLMNTPRQWLIYKALGLPVPRFAHMPLILAPDRSKLSKRHGAVSVNQYSDMGFLPSGLVNYLAQLGWNDGTNKEIYSIEELVEAFELERMSKVSAIFDKDKCKWVNGHHIRLLPDDETEKLIGGRLAEQGLVKEASGEFVRRASTLLRERIGTLTEAGEELRGMMEYDIEGCLASDKAKKWLEDGSLKETAALIVDMYENGDFDSVSTDKTVMKTIAKSISEARGGVKKKALLVPLRLCLTANDIGPDMGIFFNMLSCVDDNVAIESVSLGDRVKILKEKFC
jgi:glutamyl-tRNA synthetase